MQRTCSHSCQALLYSSWCRGRRIRGERERKQRVEEFQGGAQSDFRGRVLGNVCLGTSVDGEQFKALYRHLIL